MYERYEPHPRADIQHCTATKGCSKQVAFVVRRDGIGTGAKFGSKGACGMHLSQVVRRIDGGDSVRVLVAVVQP